MAVVRDDEIAAKSAGFAQWHFPFDLRGHQTPTNAAKARKHHRRVQYFIEPVIRHYGGTLAGKRVLDLGCNAGFHSLTAIEAGADFVLGVDARDVHIEQANFVFEVKGVGRDRYEFVAANVFDYDYSQTEPFDIVLCLGLLYHTSKPITLLEVISAANRDMLVIDTTLSTIPGSFLEVRRDEPGRLTDSADYELVMHPTAQAIVDMTELFGYRTRMLRPPEKFGVSKYQRGKRRAFICAKTSDIDDGAFEFEDVESLYEAAVLDRHRLELERVAIKAARRPAK